MDYGIDLKKITLQEYLKMLQAQNLLPGRRLLLEHTDENFSMLQSAGISNAEELLKSLGTPQKLSALSQKTNISTEYLTLLKRELSGLVPKPVSIASFPDVAEEDIQKLSAAGIQTSKDLFQATNGFSALDAFCKKTGLSEDKARGFAALCDLVRINGIGPVFARILSLSGVQNIAGVADASPEELLQRFERINTQRQYVKMKPGLKDMQYCIRFAKLYQ